MTMPAGPTVNAAPRFASACAWGESGKAEWGRLAYSCVERLGPLAGEATLGFVYVTDALAGDLPEIIAFLRRTTSVADWFGSVGIGIVAGDTECFDKPGIALLAAALPREAFCLVAGADDLAAARAWAGRAQPMLGIVHADPRAPELVEQVEALARELSVFLVGGLASSRGAMDQVAGKVVQGGVSGVVLASEVGVVAGLSQGCSPIGPKRQITGGKQNVIFEIDGRPALDVFKEDIGEVLSRRLDRVGGYIHVAFPVAGSDTGDYVVRNLVGIDPQRGWIAIGDEATVGASLIFVRRDRDAAERDLVRMLSGLKRRLPGTPRAGLYFSCVARGPNLFGPDSAEVAIVRRELGEFPLVGMFCNGEICNDRLYGYTGVLALFV
jgi:small ligand-binding sensory domain FIST